MAITIKSKSEIEKMREAGRLLSLVHDEMAKHVKPGVSTMELNRIGEDMIRSFGCVPSFLNYDGYPASICTSVNDRVVHGIPSKHDILKEGDIISLDAGLIYQGYHSDAARTWLVGEVAPEVKKLVEVTQESFFVGIKLAKAGNHLYDISAAIVRDLVGHGIGTSMHEDPQIPNFRQHRRGVKLQAGMTLAIEPMVNMGGWEVRVLDDDWTIVTEDGSRSSHYENTILVTDGEPEILSLR